MGRPFQTRFLGIVARRALIIRMIHDGSIHNDHSDSDGAYPSTALVPSAPTGSDPLGRRCVIKPDPAYDSRSR